MVNLVFNPRYYMEEPKLVAIEWNDDKDEWFINCVNDDTWSVSWLMVQFWFTFQMKGLPYEKVKGLFNC